MPYSMTMTNLRPHLAAPLFVLTLALAPIASAQDATTDTTTSDTATTDTAASDGAGGGSLTARPLFFGVGLGFIAGFSGGISFRLTEHVGYRFIGFDLGSGLELALWAALGLGQAFGDGGFYLLDFNGVFGADLEVWDGGDMQLVVTPMLGLGGAAVGVTNGLGGSRAEGAFHLQFAAQAQLVLLDGLLGVWLRPLVFDGFVRDGGFGAYSLLGGVDFHF